MWLEMYNQFLHNTNMCRLCLTLYLLGKYPSSTGEVNFSPPFLALKTILCLQIYFAWSNNAKWRVSVYFGQKTGTLMSFININFYTFKLIKDKEDSIKILYSNVYVKLFNTRISFFLQNQTYNRFLIKKMIQNLSFRNYSVQHMLSLEYIPVQKLSCLGFFIYRILSLSRFVYDLLSIYLSFS